MIDGSYSFSVFDVGFENKNVKLSQYLRWMRRHYLCTVHTTSFLGRSECNVVIITLARDLYTLDFGCK